MSAKSKVSIATVVVVAFLFGIFFTTMGANLFGLGEIVGQTGWAQSDPVSVSATPGELQDAFVEVSEKVNPAVVQIQAERVVQRQQRMRDFLEEFFGRRPQGGNQEFRRPVLGSGVIIRPNGYIITNNHVVENAEDLSVRLFDGSEYTAEVVGTDPVSDIAVIQIEQAGLPYISFGTADNVRVGQWVLAFGSPLDPRLSNTVTAGIISALGRNTVLGQETQERRIQNFIQTDAAINPGNSGGPLVNLEGQLVGINNAIYSQTGGYQGIGFAIPVDVVQNATEQLIETGTVERARLGVSYTNVSEALARAMDLPRGAAQIARVVPGGPADEAGLQEGDVIVAIDGNRLDSYLDLGQSILRQRPGTEVTMTIIRDEERRQVDVELGTLEGGGEPTASADEGGSGGDQLNGESRFEDQLGFEYMTLRDVPPQLGAQRFNIENTDRPGVLITSIDQQSYAYETAELRPGMIIVGMAGERVRTGQDLQNIYANVPEGEPFIVIVQIPGLEGSRRTALVKQG